MVTMAKKTPIFNDTGLPLVASDLAVGVVVVPVLLVIELPEVPDALVSEVTLTACMHTIGVTISVPPEDKPGLYTSRNITG
jgi:hypothetical protein